METIVWIVLLATCIWVVIDAKSIGVKKGMLKGFFDLGPWGWFWVCVLLWIIGFPAYLIKRGEYIKLASGNASPEVATGGKFCSKCGTKLQGDAGFCSKCGNKM